MASTRTMVPRCSHVLKYSESHTCPWSAADV